MDHTTIPAGLMYSVPVKSLGNGSYEVVRDVELSDFAKSKIELTTKELVGEREIVKDLLRLIILLKI